MKATAHFAAVCWIIFVLVWLISAFSVKATKTRQPWIGRLVYLWLGFVVAVLLIVRIGGAQLNRPIVPHTIPVGILADVIIAIGLSVAIWARIVLGGNWSSRVTLKEGHELIQRGPYRIIRHPIYSGLLLMVLGTVILAGRVVDFMALLLSFLGVWMKLRQEEKLLTEHLPGYAEYMTRTKALIPFVL